VGIGVSIYDFDLLCLYSLSVAVASISAAFVAIRKPVGWLIEVSGSDGGRARDADHDLLSRRK
jgi:hypothetical protein